MNKISRLAGQTAIYGLGSIIPRILNFLLFPLHTRVFDPEAYGVVSYLYVFVALLNIVYTFGMETAYFRFATKQGNDPKQIYNQALTAVITISFTLSLLIIILSGPLAAALSIPGKGHYIVWLAIIMFIDALVAIPFARLRLENKPLKFAAARLINIAILVGLNLYFFVFSTAIDTGVISFATTHLRQSAYGIEYVFLANLIANAFYLIYFFNLLREWRWTIDKDIFNTMVRYSYPIMITGLAGMTNEMFSRWTLEWWLPDNYYPGHNSMYAVGLFSAAYKYAVIMSLAIQAYRYAAEPFFFSNAGHASSPKLFARTNHYFVVFMGLILLGVTVNLDILKFLIAKDYYESLSVVPVLLMSYLFLGLYYNYSVWFKLTDRTQAGTYITIGGAIITVALNFALIPVSGYVGSSWASLACYGSMAAACYLMGQKYYPIPYHMAFDAFYILMALALMWASAQFKFEQPWTGFSFHAGIVAIYVIIAFILEKNKWKTSLSE